MRDWAVFEEPCSTQYDQYYLFPKTPGEEMSAQVGGAILLHFLERKLFKCMYRIL
jgi:hypothetical protein